MPLTDVSQVTQTLVELLTQVLARDTAVGTLEISAAPPDDDGGQFPSSISVHLFHVQEDREGSNHVLNTQHGAQSPVQQTRMGLILNYIITARSTVQDQGGAGRALIEQRLLGFVARALHDYPIIDDDTTIPSIAPALANPPLLQVFNLRGNGNQLHIVLRPVDIDESINFWSAEQESIPRLSLFYEIRLVQLQTPEPEVSAPPVLSVAEFLSVSGKLNLTGTRSLLGFSLPANHPLRNPASPFRFIEASPARISLFPMGSIPVAVPIENNRISFEGSGFQGDQSFLSLEGPIATGVSAPTEQRIRISLTDSANPELGIQADGARISMGFRHNVVNEDGTAFELYPGLYRARIVVGTQISDNPQPRFLENSSADAAFAVAPQIRSVVLLGGGVAARRFRITLFGDYLRDELDIQLAISGTTLNRNANTAIAGHYDFAVDSGVIDCAVDTTNASSPLSIRMLMNGAEAAPAWAEF